MTHLVPVTHPSHLDICYVRLVIVIIGGFLDRVILCATRSHLLATLRIHISLLLLLLLLCLIADLDVSQVVLVVSVNCPGDSIRLYPLLDASLVGTDQLVLGRIMLIMLVQGVPADLNLPAIEGNLWPMRHTSALLRLRLLSLQL